MQTSLLDTTTLAALVGAPESDNLRSVHAGLVAVGHQMGLTKPHRLVPYLAQLTHESNAFRYDKEIWGPTPAQQRYDIRTDLGNTPEVDGDGYKYRGRGPIQVTGKDNYAQFTKWVRAVLGPHTPDFVETPDLLNTDPYEGLSPLWYWDTRRLNLYADSGDMYALTKRINGGLNGIQDRLRRYDDIALRFLGYSHDRAGIYEFQKDQFLQCDGIIGPLTRAELHKRLGTCSAVPFGTKTPAKARTLLDLIIEFFSSLLKG